MKNFGKLFLLGCLAMGLVACNNEEAAPQGEDLSNNAVYMQVKLELPQTRSKTDNDQYPSDAKVDNEEGTAKENKISNLQLVLVDKTSGAEIGRSVPSSLITAGVDMYIAPFKSDELVKYADPSQEKEVLIYALCNTTLTKATALADDKTEKPGVEAIWADNNFMMTNASQAVGKLPNKTELAKHNTADNPVVIGAVEVERVAARFDFAKNHVSFNMENEKGVADAQIVLEDMAMFNIADQAFKVRRVSGDGQLAGAVLAGKEMGAPANYVVDVPSHGFTAVNEEDLTWQSIAALNVADNWNNQMSDPDVKKEEFFFYRYGVENTFAESENQNQGYATGISFRGQIKAINPESGLGKSLATKKPIYIFNNVLYGDWARVENAANQGPTGNGEDVFAKNDALKGAFDAATRLISGGKTEVEAAKLAGFKVFEATPEGKYLVYYNYYNRHNDNGNVKKSGPMEFAVVRNNVYKLRVDSISKYGTPDWVKPDPNKPIETDEIFFQVTVKILPWTVRVNNIEF